VSPTDSRPPPAEAAVPSDALDEFLFDAEEEAKGVPNLAPESAATAPPDEPLREFLAFSVSEEEYAVPIGVVREIVRDPVTTEAPRAPAYVLGLIMVRGQVVPLFNLRSLLGLSPEPGPRMRVRAVIVDVGRGPCALVVDRVRQVLRLRDSSIEPTPPGVGGGDSESFLGIARVQDRLVAILDITRILGETEA
jgi:purine-binding chemotaxis protein CheW